MAGRNLRNRNCSYTDCFNVTIQHVFLYMLSYKVGVVLKRVYQLVLYHTITQLIRCYTLQYSKQYTYHTMVVNWLVQRWISLKSLAVVACSARAFTSYRANFTLNNAHLRKVYGAITEDWYNHRWYSIWYNIWYNMLCNCREQYDWRFSKGQSV